MGIIQGNVIQKNDFGDGQKREIHNALAAFMEDLARVAPQIAPHFLSGGTLEIKTMSGVHLRFGFSPQVGGIIIPGGIRPQGQNGSVIG